MTPEERAKEFCERALWQLVPMLKDQACIEIQAMIKEAYEHAAQIAEEHASVEGIAQKIAAAIRAKAKEK